jgi:hypothetical protein
MQQYIFVTISNLVLRMEDMETKRSELWGMAQINKTKIKKIKNSKNLETNRVNLGAREEGQINKISK